MVNEAVADTGPIMHLYEIQCTQALKIFSRILIPPQVVEEIQKNKTPVPTHATIKKLTSEAQDTMNVLIHQHDLDLGEAATIALALQEKTPYVLTDDLDARRVAKEYNLEVHGTLGIVLRSFREKIIDKSTAAEKMKEIKTKSSLFITQELINEAIKAITNFKQ